VKESLILTKGVTKEEYMAETTLKIEGMSCQHCVMNVKKVLDTVQGITSSEVSIGSAKVVYREPEANEDTIREAIQKAGYKVAG
jgi:copper chaperone CopZ